MRRSGIVLGRIGFHILRFRGVENVLLAGAARSGKGVGVLIPSLLELDGHACVIDIRGETWTATSGWRSQQEAQPGALSSRTRCLKMALGDPHSARFSLPLAIRKGTPYEFMDAAVMAEVAMETPDDAQKDNPHWQGTARAALACALLYEIHKSWRPTMTNMASFWSQPGKEPRELVAYVRETAPTRQVAELAQEVLNKEPREASSVLSSMTRQLFLFRDPLVAQLTATSDFRLEDFTRTDRWTSLYLVLTPAEIAYLKPYLRMFLRMALGRWMEIGDTPHNITFVLDEFHSFGKLQYYADQLGVLGGRGIRTVLAVQNVPQLRIYGDTDLITEACKVRIYFGAQGQTTAREISRQTGTGTATTVQESYRANGWSWAMADSRTQQRQQHARPLVTESESMQLPPAVSVIQAQGCPPIWAQKVRYFTRQPWKRRSQIPAPPGRVV
jgi:type IV secretion system protein VirD4